MNPIVDPVIELFNSISRQLGPQYLAYWALPNTVLTLCGARAYCDGVFWGNGNKDSLDVWDKEINESLEVIKKQVTVVWSDASVKQVRSGEKYANFELITKGGLHHALTHTGLLDMMSFDEVEARASLPKIADLFVAKLKAQAEFKKYPEQSLHDIAFGILLGYPDKAIAESVLKWNDDDPFAEPIIDADIRGGNYYICPQPVYSYPRHLVNDPAIVTHEKLWSRLLKDYYQSGFHKSLEKNSGFQRKMHELGNLR